MRSAALVLLLALSASGALALEWETQHAAIKTQPLQRHVDIAFPFTNRGTKPVTIQRVDSSCDCLEATASATTVGPGASGAINARFTVGDRFGVYRRTISVVTDEGAEPVALQVELDVPEVARLAPRSVEWKLQAAAEPQVVAITVAEGIDLSINSVQGTSDAFTYRLETVEAGKRYRLHLAPQSTAAPANAAFRLFAKAGDRDLVFSAYANVR